MRFIEVNLLPCACREGSVCICAKKSETIRFRSFSHSSPEFCSGAPFSPFGLRRRLPPLRRRRRRRTFTVRRQLILSIFGQFVCGSLLRGRLARRTRLLRLLMRSLALFRCILFWCGSGSILLLLALTAFLGHSGGILTVAARTLYHAALRALELGQRVLRTVVQLHLAGAAQHLRGNDLSSPLRRIHHAALLGRDLLQLGIGFVLIFETAHQPPAGAGYFGRVKRQVLILGHIDRNRMEVSR